jgi:HEPN domain-containing protein
MYGDGQMTVMSNNIFLSRIPQLDGMRFVSDRQRKAVMAKLNEPGLNRKPTEIKLHARSPYHTKGKTIPIQNPADWLEQAAALQEDAEKLERAGGSNEGVFRQAYPAAEITIKAARGEHETGKKGHELARPLGKLAAGQFSEAYTESPGVAGRIDEVASRITPELISLAKEVEAFWPPYMDAKHGPIDKEAKDKTLRLAKLLNQILQPKPEKEREKGGTGDG